MSSDNLDGLKSIYPIEKPNRPFVYIVGAGPGDVGLVTLKAFQLITQIADVVVYDRLICDDIINLIPKSVNSIYAGKSCKKHHMTQDEINDLLVKQAQQGKVVVRLKGGDPFIFGRGGEEAQHLIENQIDFQIVPGVNAADGCSAYEGVPLTHRGVASSVRFITGHKQKNSKVELDWKSLSDPDTTLVIYMGLARLQNICEKLIEHGLPSDTPAIAIENGTTCDKRRCFARLDNLFDKTNTMQFKAPTLIIIGKVVSLSPNFLSDAKISELYID